MENKKKILFVITQFFKGGAEVALLNLLNSISPKQYDVDFLIFDQVNLPNAVSLLSNIPPWVKVCNAAEKEGIFAYPIKIGMRIYRKLTKKQLCRLSALKFVQGKEYDMAFSYGEWMSPEFVATKVKAKRKAVWIHTDIDKSLYVDEQILFGWDKYYTDYIYVSNMSQQGTEEKYNFLRGRGTVIHNMCDDSGIKQKSLEPITLQNPNNLPILVTVANIRPEKNHLRQVEAMNILKQRGLDFLWINIGFAGDLLLKQQLTARIQRHKLQDSFILVGADQNPYKYMVQAKAVCNLSDYESWSIVITEAKLLGIPVIATKTSGALEQIEENKTGLLCDFTAEDIADKIELFLNDKLLQQTLRSNLQGFETSCMTLSEFSNLIGRI